jgi:Fic family protein
MRPDDFASTEAGRCQKTLTGYWAFLPNALPPTLAVDWKLAALLSEADRALAELSGAGRLLRNPHLLIQPYLHREAILSSRIENTYAEMEELFRLEAGETASGKSPDVQEVANYVRALENGLKAINKLPISKRLICELHNTLLSNVRGGESTKTPGEFRRSQNWIGHPGSTVATATFVPPPPDAVLDALSNWEKYLHSDSVEPLLVKCALLHYQFEAIHPFLDGNGRIGRVLITLFLCERGCLSQPLLYLSGFFEAHRGEYYEKLLAVSQRGDWRGWVEYFLTGIREQARSALKDAQAITDLYEAYSRQWKEASRAPSVAMAILDELFANPFFSTSRFAKKSGQNFPSTQKGVEFWIEKGLLTEITGQRRNRFFVAKELLEAMRGQLQKGT